MPIKVDKTKKRRKPVPPKIIRKLLSNPVIKSLIYGRVVLSFLLLLFQFFLFILFIYWLIPYTKYFFSGSIVLSLLFVIYLMNSSGKNEYKLAWMIPVIVTPLFGIGLYVLFHMDIGLHTIKKRIKKVKTETAVFMTCSKETAQVITHFPLIRDISQYLEKEGNYSSYMDTAVTYYPSGEVAFPVLLKNIQNAEHFIFIEYFIINPGYMWDTILTALIKKVQKGVEVRVIYDAFGSTALSPRRYAKYLESFGIHAYAFIPVIPVITTRQNNRDHRKILVCDGTSAFTGGINISDEYINRNSRRGYWKDTVIKLEGPAVRSFTGMFLCNWNTANRMPDDYHRYINVSCRRYPSAGVVIPYGDDAYNNEDIAENVYCYIVGKAQKYVHITTPYIVLDNQILNALTFAAHRGIDVTMLVPARADHYITFCIGRIFINTLIANGVHVYEFTPGFIHAKMFIADGEYAVVGSINLDYRSLYNQFECGAFMYQKTVINEIEDDFLQTKACSTEITTEKYKKSPVFNRIVGRVFRLAAPLV
jgi:cardiolipin synthase A/B